MKSGRCFSDPSVLPSWKQSEALVLRRQSQGDALRRPSPGDLLGRPSQSSQPQKPKKSDILKDIDSGDPKDAILRRKWLLLDAILWFCCLILWKNQPEIAVYLWKPAPFLTLTDWTKFTNVCCNIWQKYHLFGAYIYSKNMLVASGMTLWARTPRQKLWRSTCLFS